MKGPLPQPPPARGGGERILNSPSPCGRGLGGGGSAPSAASTTSPTAPAKGFPPPPGGFTGLFAVRQGDAVHVYVNSCPHIGTPLDWMPDRFLSADGSLIVCATHGAEFRIADGECLRGPASATGWNPS